MDVLGGDGTGVFQGGGGEAVVGDAVDEPWQAAGALEQRFDGGRFEQGDLAAVMREDAWKSYESWRRLWLSGGDCNDIAALRFHGLRGALAGAGAAYKRARERPPPASAAHAEGLIADAAMAEAVSQVRRLLSVAPAAAVVATACNYGENRHV